MRALRDRGPVALAAAGLFLGAVPTAPSVATTGEGARAFAAVRTHAEAPPPAHTGGFGEPTCHVCHTEYALDLQGGSLDVAGFPEAYEPGGTYVLTVTLVSSEMERAGFELATRHEDGRQAGSLRSIDGATAVTTADGVEYAHHNEHGSLAASPEVATWSVEWTAPVSGGSVHLHAAANSANGDNSPFGDLIYTAARESPSGGGAPPLPR